MSTSESFAVSMMIGTLRASSRIWRHTSVPGIPGSMRSSSTMSAPRSRNAASAAGRPRRSRPRSPRGAAGRRAGRLRSRLVLDDQDAGHAGLRSWVLLGAGAAFAASCALRLGCGWSAGASIGGRRMVKVEPRPGRDHSAHVAAVALHGVLDDRRGRGRCRRCGASAPGRRGRSARTRAPARPRGCRCPGR